MSILFMHVHLRLLQVLITHEPNTIYRRNLYPSTSLAESQKAVEARGCKPWVPNLSIVPHTLGMLTANIYLQYYFYLNHS